MNNHDPWLKNLQSIDKPSDIRDLSVILFSWAIRSSGLLSSIFCRLQTYSCKAHVAKHWRKGDPLWSLKESREAVKKMTWDI